MKKKVSKNSFRKKSHAIVTHKGFIAVSMFALGSLLPFAFPTPTPMPSPTDAPSAQRSFEFMKKNSPFPSGTQGCHTETTENGVTTICNQNQTVINGSVLQNKDGQFPRTVPLPALTKFCHYDGTRLVCNSPLPSNIPLPSGMTMPVIPSIIIPLPSLPANCKYKTNGTTVAVACEKPSGTPTEPSVTTTPPTDTTMTITPIQQQAENDMPRTKKNVSWGSFVNFFKSLFHL